ncbi:MAG: DUF58 domain-containing protein [Deltaproteobacteria bacterium]|nr:DUF58 domain-containing protein [Candidatus Zymogenaceae bacterium]
MGRTIVKIRAFFVRIFTPPRTLKINTSGRYFIGITLAVGLAATNTGNNLLYIILGALLSFVVASGILSNSALKKLQFSRVLPDRVFSRTPILYGVSVFNQKKYAPSYLITIRDGSVAERSGLFPIVTAGETASTVMEAVFPKRGRHTMEKLTVTTTFPFGLFTKGMTVDPGDEVMVLPRIKNVVRLPEELRTISGDESRSASGTGEEPWNIVEFASGDNPRHIHWKSSAKRDEIMKKEFMAQAERMMTFRLVDIEGDEDILEERIEQAATLTDHFIRKGHPVGLWLPDRFIAPKRGAAQCTEILEALALFEPHGGTTITTPNPDITGMVIDV